MSAITVRVWGDGALQATRVDRAADQYQLLQEQGNGRFKSLVVRGPTFAETELDLERAESGVQSVTRSQCDAPGRLHTDWARSSPTRTSVGVVVPASGWHMESADADGSSRHTEANEDATRIVVEVRDQDGELVERRELTGPKNDRAVKVTDGNGNTLRKESERRDWTRQVGSTTFTSDKQVTEYGPDGAATKVIDTHTVSKFDNATGKTTTTTTFEEHDYANGGFKKGMTESDGVSSNTKWHEDWDDGSSGDFTESSTPGHHETHMTARDDQGNVTGSADQTEDTWNDRDGTHTDTHTDNTSGADHTHQDTSTVEHQDGSSETTWEKSTDGSTNTEQRGSSVTDKDKNTSTSTSTTDKDTGNTTTTTTTTDKDGNGTEHTTVTDSNDNVVSDETKEVHPDSSTPNPDDGTDEGPRLPTQRVGKALDEIELGGESLTGDDGDYGHEQSPLVTGQIARDLKDVVVETSDGTGWGDAGGEGPQGRPYIDMDLPDPPGAIDDWGDITNPKALVATVVALRAYVFATAGARFEDLASRLDAAISGVGPDR
jgi:hypothetical protein